MILRTLATAGAQSELADRIEAEGDALVGALGSPWTWLFLGVLIAVLVGSWLLRRFIAKQERFSLQVRTVAISVNSALTLVLALAASLFFLHQQAPLLTALSLMLLGVVATVAFSVSSRGWVRAIVALWRGTIRVGDSLQLGDLRGRVDSVGLFRVVVETDDGGHMYIPTDRFGREVYSVSSPERVFPVEVQIYAARNLSETDLETLRRIAALSPYREDGSSIIVEPGPDPTRATVRFRSWSEDGARHARAHLTAAFALASE